MEFKSLIQLHLFLKWRDKMRTDSVIRVNAMNLLLKGLGEVETERFIFLIKRENFNYTEWQRTLWDDLTIDEVFKLAADRENKRIILTTDS